jgi:hypothetical protein
VFIFILFYFIFSKLIKGTRLKEFFNKTKFWSPELRKLALATCSLLWSPQLPIHGSATRATPALAGWRQLAHSPIKVMTHHLLPLKHGFGYRNPKETVFLHL